MWGAFFIQSGDDALFNLQKFIANSMLTRKKDGDEGRKEDGDEGRKEEGKTRAHMLSRPGGSSPILKEMV